MSSNATIFSGTSRYSNDFQQIIDRAVAIASLPMVQLESQKTTLTDQSTALSALDTKFTSVQSAIQSLESALTDNSYSTTVSDGTVVRASVAGTVLEGTYSVEVIDVGSYTNTMSMNDLPTVTDPFTENISAESSFTLTVDGVDYTITPESNTLSAMAEAINAETDADVQATIVNIGTSSSPDYRLSLQSGKLGGTTIQLNDGSRDLLDTLSTGTLATYKVNGQPSTAISTDSREVTVAPGLTVTLLKAGTADVTVSRGTTAVGNALSSLVTAYNEAADELDVHRGEESGALSGDSLLYTLSQSLRDLTGYSTGTDGISSLTALGLNFDDQGKLSLDTTTFSTATDGQFQALETFLGSSSSSGFLKSATDLLDSLEDSTDGIIKTALSSVETQIVDQDDLIANEQQRIDQLEESLVAQMAAADALIASLEQQANYMNGLFEAMQAARASLL
jgi:flagellar hook-associated protein 2